MAEKDTLEIHAHEAAVVRSTDPGRVSGRAQTFRLWHFTPIPSLVRPQIYAGKCEWGGQFEKQVRAEARFRVILALVLGLMIVLLYAEFGILRHVLLILGAVPLATLGGLIALHATAAALNVASGVGFIALFGIAVMNGVIMVANLNRVRDHGVPLFEAVLAGASERLRPVLMTATVATVGMLPAALATDVGSDVQRDLAIVVTGGLLLATFLTLVIIPTFYFVLERRAANRVQAAAA
jgi:cobalt-zinc-cadmium resistance protein CzcA